MAGDMFQPDGEIENDEGENGGMPKAGNRPQPLSCAKIAVPTAAAGKMIRSATDDNTTIERLVNQRLDFQAPFISSRSRRGDHSSKIAMETKIARKAASLIVASEISIALSCFRDAPAPDRAAAHQQQVNSASGQAKARPGGTLDGRGDEVVQVQLVSKDLQET